MVICGTLMTEATCTAKTKCLWDTDCELNAAGTEIWQIDFMSAMTAVSQSTAGDACEDITTETACTTASTCVWRQDSGCMTTIATAEAALTAISAPAGVQGFLGVYTTGSTTCAPATASATTCSDL